MRPCDVIGDMVDYAFSPYHIVDQMVLRTDLGPKVSIAKLSIAVGKGADMGSSQGKVR